MLGEIFTQERKDKIRQKAIERAKIKNPIVNIYADKKWNEKAIKAKLLSGRGKQPHKRNRKLLKISDDKLKEMVLEYGILGLSRLLDCSQWSIRNRAYKLGLKLKYGPRPALTKTETYKTNMKIQRMNQKFPLRGTTIEIAIWNELNKRGIQFEKHKAILGCTQPDVFIEPNICIYADGDYWHNRLDVKEKDERINAMLIKNGYKVFRFWEHEINTNVASCISKVVGILTGEKRTGQ